MFREVYDMDRWAYKAVGGRTGKTRSRERKEKHHEVFDAEETKFTAKHA